MVFQKLHMFTYFLQYLALAAGYGGPYHHCKAIPGSEDWPKNEEWTKLNRTLSGQLIKTVPPGGICHPTYPTFDPIACPVVAAAWGKNVFHAANPVSSMENNWNNDTCLPIPTFPCSGKGYPVYVVNATNAEHVKKGIDFARKHEIRLIVKGTGHDYMGRSSAPYALSIWTHNMKGLKFYDKGKFKPKRCRKTIIDTAAITVAAGVPMLELDEQANLRNLVIVSGGAGTVGVGGYLTGGGHGAISPIFGLGADQVLEIEMVTPTGDIITANECQHNDLFWAMRGGGGSTFGVLTAVTIKAFPSFKFANAIAFLGAALSATDEYWDAIGTILSQYPFLTDKGISAYSFIARNQNGSNWGLPFPVNGYYGSFNLPLIYPENTTESLVATVESMFASATAPAPPMTFYTSVTGRIFPNFWTFYKDNNGPQDGGNNNILTSRLLDREALTGNETALKEAVKKVAESQIITANLVGGKGVHNAKIPGGSNAVNPAWRKAYLHIISSTSIPPLTPLPQKHALEASNTQIMQPLRDLSPNSGAYVNEADPHEPNFQQSFWGGNYERLLRIKRRVDPGDVFWCDPCVGNERWKVVEEDGTLCRV